MRLATIDTILNPEGMDDVLKNIYSPTSDMTDLHCQSAWSFFGDSANIPIYEVTDDNGKTWLGDDSTEIKTERGKITFKDLKETDVILEYIGD